MKKAKAAAFKKKRVEKGAIVRDRELAKELLEKATLELSREEAVASAQQCPARLPLAGHCSHCHNRFGKDYDVTTAITRKLQLMTLTAHLISQTVNKHINLHHA
jgi:hypothetical protein